MEKVKMVPVESSNLKAIGWVPKDPEIKDSVDMIVIEFHRGAKYNYWPVKELEFTEATRTKNISAWFNIFKTGKNFKKVE